MGSTFRETATFTQGIKVPGGYLTEVKRSELQQDTLKPFVVPWYAFRVHDAYATNLPGTSASDDLGLYGNTFATGSPSIRSYDVKTVTTNLYARFMVALPPEYDDAETVQIRCHAGMVTTVADGSCTLDLVAYESDKEASIGADLCTTAATTMNSLTHADIDFTITSSGLVAGDVLDCRLDVSVADTATGTAVIAEIGYVALLCDVRG